MLELAALGLLQKQPLNGYRLKQQLELFMSGCISVNYGAIYPLLKRLEAQGAIAVLSEAPDDSSGRRVYCITEVGRQSWKQQMLEHPHESWVNSRSRFLIKFFFFSHLDSQERTRLLKHRFMVCQLRLESQVLLATAEDPYEAIAWQRALDMLHREIQWLEEQLTRELAELPQVSAAETSGVEALEWPTHSQAQAQTQAQIQLQ